MIPGDFIASLRRQQVPIEAAELQTLDRDGARCSNFVTARGIPRARARLRSGLLMLAFMVFCAYKLGWSGSGLLAFLLLSAAVTVFIDGLRMGMAQRWVYYSHLREFRAEEMLLVARNIERNRDTRPAPRSRQQWLMAFYVAAGCTAIGLPLTWFFLVQMAWANWNSVFANLFLPLFLLVSAVWRIVRAIQDIKFVKASTVGSRDLCLDSDDALDTYVLALLFAALLPLGPVAALSMPFLVILVRVGYRAYLFQWQRQSLQLLGRRVYRLHPDARKGKSSWDEEVGEDGAA